MKSLLFASTLIMFAGTVHADEGGGRVGGLFVEPAVTYESGKTTVNYPSPLSSSTGDLDGLGIAARLGVHVHEIIFLGADARYSMPKFKDSGSSYDATATSANWGVFGGVQTPIVGLRAWAGYILGGELNPEASNNLDVKFSKANGYRVGAGFRLALVSLNLEYQQLKYGQTTLEKIGPFSSSSALDSVNLETKSWIASVSFPFEL